MKRQSETAQSNSENMQKDIDAAAAKILASFPSGAAAK